MKTAVRWLGYAVLAAAYAWAALIVVAIAWGFLTGYWGFTLYDAEPTP